MSGINGSDSNPAPADPQQPHHAPEFERRFLRISVEGMAAQRPSCTCCGRSPLVGERMRVFAVAGQQRQAVCDLCVAESPAASLGEPVGVVRVGASERRLTVRRAA